MTDPTPQPPPQDLTSEQLMEVMPQRFRDDLAAASELFARNAKEDIGAFRCRVLLNTAAVAYARAAIAADRATRSQPTVNLRVDASPECLKLLCDGLAAAVKPDGGYAAATSDDPPPGPDCYCQTVGVECWIPQHGCDSLENTLDAIKARILTAVMDWWSTAMAPTVAPAVKEVPPSGYAYRYPGPYGGIRFNNGAEVNGSSPCEAIPYWFSQPPTTTP